MGRAGFVFWPCHPLSWWPWTRPFKSSKRPCLHLNRESMRSILQVFMRDDKGFLQGGCVCHTHEGLINATSLPVHQHAGSLTCRRETHLVPWTWMKPRAFRAQIAMQAFRSDWCLCLKGSLISPEKAGRTKHARDLQFPNGGMWANGK